MTGRRLAGIIGAALVAATALPAGAASPGDCTWGQPGYRACVDDLITKRRAQDGQGDGATAKATPEPKRETFRTAPARKRPPALTPLDGSGQSMAPVRLPPVPTLPTDNQRTMDDNLMRMRRDADRPAIMPLNNDFYPPTRRN